MSRRRSTLVLAAVAALALAPSVLAGGAGRIPGVPEAFRPRYSHSSDGFAHFVADQLEPLVEGEAFTWEGARYEVVKLASIKDTETSRWEPARSAEAVMHRGRVVAVIHVKVDGVLKVGRIVGTADYVTQHDGWIWNEVVLYLGRNQSYDFVTGEAK